jgi:flagellar protein FlaG
MASEAISTLIILIASLIIAGIVASVMVGSFSSLSDVIDDRSDRAVEQIDTDVDIINDPDTVGTYDNSSGELTVYVKNTGGERIPNDPDGFDLFLDGEYQQPDSMTIQGGDDWRPGNVAEITVDTTLDDGRHQVKIVVNSNEDTMDFYV